MLPFYSFYYSIYICYYCIYICYETRLMMEMLREKGDNRKYTPPFSASPLSPPQRRETGNERDVGLP